jgi:hypothetical protein
MGFILSFERPCRQALDELISARDEEEDDGKRG